MGSALSFTLLYAQVLTYTPSEIVLSRYCNRHVPDGFSSPEVTPTKILLDAQIVDGLIQKRTDETQDGCESPTVITGSSQPVIV